MVWTLAITLLILLVTSIALQYRIINSRLAHELMVLQSMILSSVFCTNCHWTSSAARRHITSQSVNLGMRFLPTFGEIPTHFRLVRIVG